MRRSLIAIVSAIDAGRRHSLERSRQSDGSAIATELLTSANSRLFRSRPMPVGLSMGLWSLRRVRVRCLWRLHSSPRLRSDYRCLPASSLDRAIGGLRETSVGDEASPVGGKTETGVE